MNVHSKPLRAIGTLAMYVWLLGGAAYYLVQFSRSFFSENEVQIRQAVTSLLGG